MGAWLRMTEVAGRPVRRFAWHYQEGRERGGPNAPSDSRPDVSWSNTCIIRRCTLQEDGDFSLAGKLCLSVLIMELDLWWFIGISWHKRGRIQTRSKHSHSRGTLVLLETTTSFDFDSQEWEGTHRLTRVRWVCHRCRNPVQSQYSRWWQKCPIGDELLFIIYTWKQDVSGTKIKIDVNWEE